jgi:hypothetical protein
MIKAGAKDSGEELDFDALQLQQKILICDNHLHGSRNSEVPGIVLFNAWFGLNQQPPVAFTESSTCSNAFGACVRFSVPRVKFIY